MWATGSPQAAAGVKDSPPVARQYALDVVDHTADPAPIEAYIDNGSQMVAWLQANSDAHFLISPPSSDWYPGVAGAVYFGRLLAPQEHGGKRLISSIWLR